MTHTDAENDTDNLSLRVHSQCVKAGCVCACVLSLCMCVLPEERTILVVPCARVV